MSAICGLISRNLDRSGVAALLSRMVDSLPLNTGIGTRCILEHDAGGFGLYQQFPPAVREGNRGRSLYQEGGLYVACAGDFYNASTLRQQLREEIPADAGEAALTAALYRQYGIECVLHLRGAFAFALWDSQRELLLVATDTFGIRPVHYYSDAEKLVFGSRIKAILRAPGVPQEIDPNAIYQYLYFGCIPTPNTVYHGIKKLPPGHYLLFSKAGLQVKEYWSMRYEEDLSKPVEYFASGLRQHLSEAVRLQANYRCREEALGSFLSGGTDSSTISGLLGQVTNRPGRTFSIGFEEDHFNEINYARIAARHFQTEHREYFVTPEDTAALIPELVQAYDEPYGNASAVPTYYCARLARENGVETLMAGDGGDELFGGNTRYVTDKVFEIYQLLPAWFRRGFFEPLLYGLPLPDRGLIDKARKYVRRSNIPQPLRFFSYHLLHLIDSRELFDPDFLAVISESGALSITSQYYQNARATSMLNRLLDIDLKITITDNDLRKVTRMCELANVQVRYPMLDQELVEFTGTIPASFKVKGFRKRYIFKKAFRTFLPREILVKKKHGFGLPISPWLRETPYLRQLAQDTLLSQAALQRGYFRRSFIEQLFDLHRGDKTNFFGDNIWVFLMLELWHQSHLNN